MMKLNNKPAVHGHWAQAVTFTLIYPPPRTNPEHASYDMIRVWVAVETV